MVTFLSAASALFLSSLIIVAIYRQKTHQVFQKHILLVAVYLLVCAIISNVVISVYVTTQGQAALQDGVILSKRVQATFDYLFGIAIGAFIFVATTTSINSRRDFVKYMKSEFPTSYVFYLFLMIMTIVGLIAFGVRGESFLQELIVPEAEAHLLTKPTYSLDRGVTYVVLERDAGQAFEIFKDLVTHGAQGLCITRRAPKAVMAEYGLERTPVLWLSRVAAEKNVIRPSPPENVAMAIEHFIAASERPAVLLDGFEYLVSHNDFGSVLALLHDLNESVAIHESILLVPFDPSAFNEREIALIRREVRLIGPMAEEFGQVTKISP